MLNQASVPVSATNVGLLSQVKKYDMGKARYIITEKDVDAKFEEFITNCHRCKSEKDKKLVRKAYNFAKVAHRGETRFSGDAFINHPLEVAKIVASEIGLSATSIAVALLHDVVTNTEIELSEVELSFGKEIAGMIEKLTKVKGTANYFNVNKSEVYRLILIGVSEDIRVILIKIADRLHNMLTLSSLQPAKQLRVANETMYVYAPLAERLGLFIIKSKLEDYAFKYMQPDDYARIAKRIKHSRKRNISYLNRFSLPIIAQLINHGIKFDIISRQKSVYSIWNKMVNKKVSLDNVFDIFAVRIIFEPVTEKSEKQEAKEIFDIVSTLYEINPSRVRNWVDEPKQNGYEALHLTVRGPKNRWVEVQIRSKRMNEIAEMGIASHLEYKGVRDKKVIFDKKINELRKKFELGQEKDFDYLSNFKLLFTTEIVVYTPKGEEILLPVGATVLDFAFTIHTKLGSQCIGAKVNSKLVPIDHRIQTGDYIEILTSATQEPKTEWLNYVTTQKVKNKLHEVLKIKKVDEKESGQNILAEILKKHDYVPTPELFQVLTKFFKLKNKHELYVGIGSGEISEDKLDNIIKKKARWQLKKFIKPQFPKIFAKAGDQIVIDDQTNYKLASCCNPIPGDTALGFKNENNEIVVHSSNCTKIESENKDFIPLLWKSYKAKSYKARIKIEAQNQFGLLNKITNVMSNSMDVSIISMHFDSVDNEMLFAGWIEFYVLNRQHLNLLTEKLNEIENLQAEIITDW